MRNRRLASVSGPAFGESGECANYTNATAFMIEADFDIDNYYAAYLDEALAIEGYLQSLDGYLETYIQLDVEGEYHSKGVTGLAEAAVDQHYVASTVWRVNTADNINDTAAGLG